MRKLITVLVLIIAAGCTYEGNSLVEYLEDPRSIIRDPHFSEYKENRDSLERQYLRKEITYAEYVKKMDELDESYAKEVQERNAKLAE